MTYAIFRSGDKQFRAVEGQTLRLPLIDAEPGADVTFADVLLTSDGENIQIGAPLVSGATVTGTVVEHGRDKKIIVFKHKRRKNYRRKNGHRQGFTSVRITGVNVG